MLSRKIFLVLAILATAGMVAVVGRSYLAPPEDQVATAAPAPDAAEVEAAPQILVAVEDMPAGSFIKPVNVRWQDWPRDAILDVHVKHGEQQIDDLVGAVVRSGIVAGEPLVDAKLVLPGERGFLAAVLTPGMRAASVAVNAVSGAAGLIFPGDRVDVILTQTLTDDDIPLGRQMVGETVLADVRVIAVDQRIQDIAPVQEGQLAPVAKTVTLEVSPAGAQSLAVAAELGAITMSLRSLGDPVPEIVDGIAQPIPAPVAVNQPTYAADVSAALNTETGAAAVREVLVLRGGSNQAAAPGAATPE